MRNVQVSMHHDLRSVLTFQNEESLCFFCMEIAESVRDGARIATVARPPRSPHLVGLPYRGWMHLIGRVEVREKLDALLEGALRGDAGSLVIRGDPGVGKTALVDYVIGQAVGFQAVHLTGIEAERELGYAALLRLLAPIVHRIEKLPELQHAALRSAFGLGSSVGPADRFMVGLATVTMAAESASFAPVLCVIDDAQWVDRESIDALVFWARRLRGERCAVVFAERYSRSAPSPLDGLPLVSLRGLPDQHAHELLATQSDLRLDPQVAERLVAETGGNPLALLEFAAELSGEQLAGVEPLPQPLPLSRRLERRFSVQVRSLPADSQTLLLLASADPTGDANLLWRAARLAGVSVDAADALETADLLTLVPRVAFRHPLIRSAVYSGATATARRKVHAVLAAATDDADADRQAWHLAAAAVGPDEHIAATLERAARRASARGGHVAEVAFLTRAAELTPDRQRAADRQVAAAEAAVAGGSPVRAQSLLALAGPGLVDARSRAAAARLEGAVWALVGDTAKAGPLLLSASMALAPIDGHLSRRTMLEALEAACLSGGAGITRRQVALVVRATRSSSTDETVADLLLDGFTADLVDGYVVGVPLLRRALAAFAADDLDAIEAIRWSVLACNAAQWLWDEETHHRLATEMIALSRRVGSLHWLLMALRCRATAEIRAGRLARAAADLAEAENIAAVTDEPSLPSIAFELRAAQGRGPDAVSSAPAMVTAAADVWSGAAGTARRAALVVHGLGAGEYQEALGHGRAVFEEDPVPYGNLILPDLVEAAVRAGDRGTANAALARLEQRAPTAGGGWALGALARGRALLAGADEAEPLYLEALDLLAPTNLAFERERVHLLYGEWLRRENRRTEARDELRRAHAAFAAMGADGFAERARLELVATGEYARKRTAAASNDLTPQEVNVARCAAAGETNSEIAARLFISASTVDYHLRKVFRKLGITSRRQLRGALPDGLFDGRPDGSAAPAHRAPRATAATSGVGRSG
jgi:DNA-binding CsgD family transcriptional regulator